MTITGRGGVGSDSAREVGDVHMDWSLLGEGKNHPLLEQHAARMHDKEGEVDHPDVRADRRADHEGTRLRLCMGCGARLTRVGPAQEPARQIQRTWFSLVHSTSCALARGLLLSSVMSASTSTPSPRRIHRKCISTLRLSSDTTASLLEYIPAARYPQPVREEHDPFDQPPPDYPDSAEEDRHQHR